MTKHINKCTIFTSVLIAGLWFHPAATFAQAPYPANTYSYPSPYIARPYYAQPYYPTSRKSVNSRSRHRLNNKNDWSGDGRLRNWNRSMTNFISDMLGDGAGDFEFDMNIKFKAKGKGKGKGQTRNRAKASSRQQYDSRYRGYYQTGGSYYGDGNSGGYSGYRSYRYIPYSRYPATVPVYTYPSYPPVAADNGQKAKPDTR